MRKLASKKSFMEKKRTGIQKRKVIDATLAEYVSSENLILCCQ